MAQHTPKQGSSPRRTIAGGFSLVAALLLALATMALPTAAAFIPATIPFALGMTPEATASFTHSPDKAKPGDTVTYTGTYTVTSKEQGSAGYDVKIAVAQPTNAAYTSEPTAGDLNVSSGLVTGPTKTDDGWVYVVKTNDIRDFSATFTKQAVVDSAADPGDLVLSSSTVTVTPTDPANITLKQTAAMVQYDTDVCTGYGEYVAEVPVERLGSWLADIKFASDPAKVTLDPLPDFATLVANGRTGKSGGALAKDPEARNSISFENIDQEQLQAIIDGGVVNNNDSTPPWGEVSPILKNLTFQDSINWKYDPATWTGEAWLQPTAKVTIHRGYNYRACKNNVALDGDPSRLNVMGLQFDNGRAAIDTEATALDTLVLPGEKKPIEWCQDLFYTDAAKGGNPVTTEIGRVTVKDGVVEGSKNSIAQMRQSYGGIAISEKIDQWAYYIKDQTLYRINLGTQETQAVGDTGSYTPQLTSMAFDPDGTLWHMSPNGQMYYWENNEKGEPTGSAIKGAYVNRPSSYAGYSTRGFVQDIGFLKDGNLVFGTGYRTGGNRANVVFTVPKDDLKSGKTSNLTEWGVYPALDYAILGIAFGPDGNLYASSGKTAIDTSRNLYLLNKGGDAVAVNYAGYARASKGILGLTSCSFGPTDQPVPGPDGVQVAKVAYDPTTGLAAPAGTTTRNKVEIKPDGSVRVRYGVIVTNIGENAKNPGVINDDFTAPEGFTVTGASAVKLNGSAKEATDFAPGNTTFTPGEIEGGKSVLYIVTIDLKADSLAAASQVNGECNTEGAGTPGGGFFNRVTMTDDADGANNNDACIPIQPPTPGHIKLTKKIVDANGVDASDPEADLPEGFDLAQELPKFQLTGQGRTAEGTPLGGVTGQANNVTGIAVDEDVMPGVYSLSESTIADSDYDYRFKDFTCEEGVLNAENTSVEVPAGGQAACTVVNTVHNPRVHIEKTATEKTADNSHIGQAVNLTQQGGEGAYTGVLKYTITVTNDTAIPADSKAVTDTFTPPAGLTWDGDKQATVRFIAGGGNATLERSGKDLVEEEDGAITFTLSKEELAQGALLANSVKNLGPAGSSSATARFQIEIPIAEDTTAAGDEGETAFLTHRDSLARCDSDTVLDSEHPVVGDTTFGAVNTVALDGESDRYTTTDTMAERDNIACIPVTKEFPAEWKVAKLAKKTADGAEGPVDFTKPGDESIGAKVTMTEVDGGYQAVATYKVVATNTGKDAATAPAISDTPTLPAGFTLTGVTYAPAATPEATVAVDNPRNGETFVIPAAGVDGAKIEPKGTVEYIVTVTGMITKEAVAAAEWTTTIGDSLNDKKLGLGECEVSGPGKPGTGFFNSVSVDGDEGEDDNDSCVPVNPPASRVLVEKTDDTGFNRLAGAEFTLFPATCADGKCTKGEGVVLAPLDEETSKDFSEDALKVYGPNGEEQPGADKLQGRFVTDKLNIGEFYYLQETKSPAADETGGFSLLPEPVLFKVVAGGKAIPVNELGDAITAEEAGIYNVSNSFYFNGGKVTVHDPRIGELPKAGGMGHWTLAGGAGLLIMVSLMFLFRANPNGRRGSWT